MKRCLAVLMVCALFIGTAMAEPVNETETRTSVVEMEGSQEEIVETRFDHADGYSIWYAADFVVPGDTEGYASFVPSDMENELNISMTIVKPGISVDQADDMLAEAVGGYDSEAEISETTSYMLDGGEVVKTVSVLEENMVYRFYVVYDDTNVLCISASFPQEAAEGYGVRFDRMVESISLHSDEEA